MLEFCLLETFRPECWKNEVIVMEEAIYGRRHVGKCIDHDEVEAAPDADDPGYLGCHANVLSLLHAKCSGKKQCEVHVPDADLERTEPCRKGLKMFLEVRHSCVEGRPYISFLHFCCLSMCCLFSVLYHCCLIQIETFEMLCWAYLSSLLFGLLSLVVVGDICTYLNACVFYILCNMLMCISFPLV